MDPRTVGLILLSLFGVGAVACAIDQHQKREDEQEASRKRTRELEEAVARFEARLKAMTEALGHKNIQVRLLALEIERCRRELAMYRRQEAEQRSAA